jgi:hypothetical protein
MTVQQRAYGFFSLPETKSVAATKTIFQTIFRTCWAAVRNTIIRLFRTILGEVNVKEEKLPRAPNLLKLWMNNPRKSTKKTACNYAMSTSSVPRTLRRILKFFPYKISVLHKRFSVKDNER